MLMYLTDVFDEFQCWVVEWQVRARQHREHLRRLRYISGTCHLFLDFLCNGENVLCELTGHVFLRERDHSCGRKLKIYNSTEKKNMA